MKKVILATIGLVVLMGFGMLQAATVDISASADTFVNSLGPNNNEGAADYIWVAPNKNGLIQFDLSAIPSGQTITSAELKLYVYYKQSNTTTRVYKETDAWTEMGATWNTTDGTTAWGGSAGGYGTGMSSGNNVLDTKTVNGTGWFTWDVTSAVQEWYSNPSTNHGLLIERVPYGQGWKCYSREYGTVEKRPILTVTYVPEPGTIGLLLSGFGLLIRRK